MIVSIEMIPTKPVFRRPTAQSGRSVARRAIFRTTEDVGESLEFVQKELLVQATESQRRWNFDFDKEHPISGGRYVWRRVNGQTPVIATDSLSDSVPDLSATTDSHTTDLEKTKQTKLSDFWSTRKRLPSSPLVVNHKKSSSVPGDAESPVKVQRTSSS